MAKTLASLGEVLFQGVTVNEFSDAVDFEQIKALGVGAAVLRATAGADYADARLDEAVRAARAAGLRVGFYHYLTAGDAQEARAQAQRFVAAISQYSYALRPALRFELLDGLNIDTANRIALAFLGAVESATGVAPALYTDAESSSLLWNRAIAEKYPLWVIDYNVEAPEAGSSPWRGWVGWAYRSSFDPACGCEGTPLSRFTAGMLAAQIVLPDVPIEPPSGEASKLICVTVSYGDTLSGIAALFSTSVDEIVALNAIENPNRIFPGQKLFLRVAESVPYPCCDAYTVRRGDTLSGIAERFSLDWRRLAAINEIANPNLIYPGQVVKLGICE